MSNLNLTALKNCLYSKIETADDVSQLRQYLEKCKRQTLHTWTDENGYDILHHAIMSGNVEAVGMIFALGHFKPPHEPQSHSYMHVAANFGSRPIVVMVMQERPRDYSIKKTKYKWTKLPTEVPMMTKDGCSAVSPLDVAADCGFVGCVRTILDVYTVKNKPLLTTYNHLSAACASNSASALRILLKQAPPEDEVKAAVGIALKSANAECLDVLLNCNPNLTTLFSGMNLYHVLYSYSMSFKKEWYESLLTVTSVLLKHKQNPASAVPFRTYPLYSLLSHMPASEFGKSSPYIVACMVVLLNAGVDPNFNESLYETKYADTNVQTAFGRSAFPSALHTLYGNVRNLLRHSPDDASNIQRFVARSTETLLRHGADPSVSGPLEDTTLNGTPLHAFLKVCLHMGLNDRSMNIFRLLIQNGSDPNTHSEGIYPVNTFIDEILQNANVFVGADFKYSEATFTELCREVMSSLLGNMTMPDVTAAATVQLEGKPTNTAQKKIFKMCKDELSKPASRVYTLKRTCRLVILAACSWRSTDVVKLPLPVAMKKYVNGVL